MYLTNYISYLFGLLTRVKWPKPLNNIVLSVYCRMFKVNCDEFALSFTDYSSLSEFFTRELKKDSRPIAGDLAMPVDGVMRSAERVDGNSRQVVKGQSFSLEELLDSEEVENFDEGYIYCLLYTSPSPRDKRQSRMPSSA